MRFKPAVAVLSALFAVVFTAVKSPADTLGKVTNAAGNSPRVSMVEHPQDALRLWHTQGQKGRTLLLISEDIPLGRLDDDSCMSALKAVSEGHWNGLSAGDYDTFVEYPVNRADYVYLAAKAGMISRVYWVPPTRDPLGAERIGRIKGNMLSLGASEAELGALVQNDKSISGTINGVPIYICNLRDLPPIDGEVVLAVDLSFFTAVYKGEVYTPYLGLVTSFMHTLATSGVKVSDAVISYSTALGPVPLEHRFIGGYLEKFLTDPGSLEGGPPAVWQLRSQGMYYETFVQSDKELNVYKQAVDDSPKDPSLRYSLAMAYFAENNIDRMKEELDKAVSLDPAYYHAYITYGTYLANDLPQAGEDFVAEAASMHPDDPAVLEATNTVKRAAGKYGEALAAQKRLVDMGYQGPEPYFDLAEDYSSLNDYANAIECYNKALVKLPVLDSQLRPQALIGLARAYESSGNIEKALETYQSAIDATVDSHARDRIREQYDKLKNTWAPFMGGGKEDR